VISVIIALLIVTVYVCVWVQFSTSGAEACPDMTDICTGSWIRTGEGSLGGRKRGVV